MPYRRTLDGSEGRLKMEDKLAHALCLIGDLFRVIQSDHRKEPEHWSHDYKAAMIMLVEYGARHFPKDTIQSHFEKALLPVPTFVQSE